MSLPVTVMTPFEHVYAVTSPPRGIAGFDVQFNTINSTAPTPEPVRSRTFHVYDARTETAAVRKAYRLLLSEVNSGIWQPAPLRRGIIFNPSNHTVRNFRLVTYMELRLGKPKSTLRGRHSKGG